MSFIPLTTPSNVSKSTRSGTERGTACPTLAWPHPASSKRRNHAPFATPGRFRYDQNSKRLRFLVLITIAHLPFNWASQENNKRPVPHIRSGSPRSGIPHRPERESPRGQLRDGHDLGKQ